MKSESGFSFAMASQPFKVKHRGTISSQDGAYVIMMQTN